LTPFFNLNRIFSFLEDEIDDTEAVVDEGSMPRLDADFEGLREVPLDSDSDPEREINLGSLDRTSIADTRVEPDSPLSDILCTEFRLKNDGKRNLRLWSKCVLVVDGIFSALWDPRMAFPKRLKVILEGDGMGNVGCGRNRGTK